MGPFNPLPLVEVAYGCKLAFLVFDYYNYY